MDDERAIPYLTLRTPRLTLRPWQRVDLDAMAAWPPYPDPLDAMGDWALVQRDPGSLDLFFIGRALDPTRREWTIATRAGEIVGHLGIREINQQAATARLGIGFGSPYVGQGYGQEALSAFLNAFFGAMAFRRLLLDVSVHNIRARRLYDRLGFRAIATGWHHVGSESELAFLDLPQYAAIRHDFQRRDGTISVRSTSMELSADDWHHTRSSRAEVSSPTSAAPSDKSS